MVNDIRVEINTDTDIVAARAKGRELGSKIGFDDVDCAIIATAISEVARNILLYAKHGEIRLEPAQQSERHGILIIARDEGPGIHDINLAMEDGYSTRNGLGLGLPGCKRLMDEFQIISGNGLGTKVTMKKWLR